MTDAKPKSASLDAPKERLLRMRDAELARMIRRGQLQRIAAIDAAPAAIDEATPEERTYRVFGTEKKDAAE